MKSRPPPQKLRQRGILRERVFGCDLGEHLHNSGHEGKFTVTLSCHEAKPSLTTLLSAAVPQVVQSCTEFIEKHGVVDGIYRLSGISSNIQKLRLWIPSRLRADLLHPQCLCLLHLITVIRIIYWQRFDSPSSSVLPGTSLTLSRSQI